jgi:DNA-binding NarL/FixJ family response regulator
MGDRLLADGKSPVLVLAATIALTHHERFDGSGYPTGLAGEEIPLEGRIAALADAFDAMTSDRVYRKAYPLEQALELLQTERGRQFDPDLLDVLSSAIEELVEIKSVYPEVNTWMRDIRVLLVDTHRMFADALTRLLAESDGISVVGTAATADAALEAVKDRQPDVVVLGQQLGGDEGTELAVRLREERPDAKVVLLADRDDDQLLLRAFEAGCAGQVIRARAFEDIVPAVIAAHADQPLIPTTRLASLLRRHDRSGHGAYTTLTRREVEVLQLLAAGLSNDAIAERFVLSLHTVRNHVQNILTKLQAHSRLEAVSIAVGQGIINFR